MQRDLNKEAWCAYHLISETFFCAAVEACKTVLEFFKREAIARNAANFGRNNQIYDSWAKHVRELAQAIEYTRYDDYAPLNEAASGVCSTNRGVNQWVFMGWLGDKEEEYHRLASTAGRYADEIEAALQCGLHGGAYWLKEAANDPPERRNSPFGWWDDSVTSLLKKDPFTGMPPLENYPHLREHPVPTVFPHYAPDTSRPCRTGETVPWTGIWIPENGIECQNLTFAIKGRPMTPVWRTVQTYEENKAELLSRPGYAKSESGQIFNEKDEDVWPETKCEITPIIWYPLLEVPPAKEKRPFVMRVEGGEPCPREGYWWSPANQSKGRVFKKGEIMPIVTSTEYARCYWLWSGEIGKK